jgi:hypothetical protein
MRLYYLFINLSTPNERRTAYGRSLFPPRVKTAWLPQRQPSVTTVGVLSGLMTIVYVDWYGYVLTVHERNWSECTKAPRAQNQLEVRIFFGVRVDATAN